MPAPLDGHGLNPLLQDPGLAFHPPFLYLGYVGFSVAFSFAVAALIEGRVDAAWARWVRPWTLAAWCALTVGIALGSWWAYYTLGWGGWWFWDPVENASFMPWLVGTALLHSAIVVEKRDALKSWTILLAIVTFSLSLIGTFLVRSGVLTSVHAFAIDPARGVFILLLLVVGDRRRADALCAARAGAEGRRAVRADLARGRAGAQQPAAGDRRARRCSSARSIRCSSTRSAAARSRSGRPFFNRTFVPLMVPLLLRDRRRPAAGLEARRSAGGAAAALSVAGWRRARRAGGRCLRRDAPAGRRWRCSASALAAWIVVGALVEMAERMRLFRGRSATARAARATCRARPTA